MQPIRQARLPLSGEVIAIDHVDTRFAVGVQNIALARIDVLPIVGDRRVILNLYGTREIDALIAALQSARTTMVGEEAALTSYLAEHPEAIIPSTEVTV